MSNDTQCTTIKYIVVGDSGVGKSSLIKRFISNTFDPDYDMTIGVEFGVYLYSKNNIPIKIQIWDTAGQERFRSITRGFYRGSGCAILVFDVCNRASFEHIKSWLDEVDNFSHTQHRNVIRIMLVGNKCDMENRQVDHSEAVDFAGQNGIDYMETSAYTGINVREAFLTLIDKYYGIIESVKPINKIGSNIKYGLCMC